MDENRSPESGLPEDRVTPPGDGLNKSGTVGTAQAPADADAISQCAEQPQNAYIQGPPQNTWQQPPYYGNPSQPVYRQPNYYRPQYTYPPQYGNYNHPSRGKATASLVLGIISLVFFWLSFFAIVSVVCSIIGIVMGNSARKELRPEQGQGQATAGLVCSIIGLVLSIIMLAVFTLIIVTAVSYTPEFGGYM